MANKNKKLEHIQVKDNGIKAAQKVGDAINTAKIILEQKLFDGLLTASNEKNLIRYKIAQNNAFRDYSINARDIIKKANKAVKTGLESDKSVNLTKKQVNSISKEVNEGLLQLGNNAVNAYQRTLNDIFLKVKSASDLKEQLSKHLASGLDIDVIYRDGKKYAFDTYFEMKARTDIQQDIGSNMIAAGKENGIIFYITSFYGDCAPDHADYQGKIYVDKDWESLAPNDRIDEIRSYINSNKILTVQEVTENKPFLTTRPNCRHYFQYISIDEVLGAKTPDDVKKLRAERSLNFNGKYKPDKYKALQQQRLNERKIRTYKADIVKKEQELRLHPENEKLLRTRIEIDKLNIRDYQKAQRELEKQYTNIERRYDREQVGNRVDLGVDDLTKNNNNGKMKIEGATYGALNDKNDPFRAKRDAHAEKFYEEIRKANKQLFIEKVSNNSGIDKNTVEKAYNHLFINEYEIDGENKRFDPSYEISISIQRLRDGKDIQEQDLVLIRHEALESEYMKEGLTYQEAHKKANEQFN